MAKFKDEASATFSMRLFQKLNTEAKEWREAAPKLEKTGTRFEFKQSYFVVRRRRQYVPSSIRVDRTCSFAFA